MTENYYQGAENAILKGSCYVILFIFMSVMITGCDENNKDGRSLNAVLSVQESPNVPGRIELDPRGSKPGVGQKLVSFTIEVTDRSTGETVFGPETVSADSDSALLKEYFPSGNYLAKLTVTATPVTMDESTAVRGTEGQMTDTAERMFSVEATIVFPEADSCQATCSKNTDAPDLTVCTLPTNCFTLDLDEDVLKKAQIIDSSVSDSTTVWIQAYGASGGSGTSPVFGGDGGGGGGGGFAQTITTIASYSSTYSTTALFYFLGRGGNHDDSGGSGGASTILTPIEPQTGNPITLDTLLLIAGGGAGGGEGGLPDANGKSGGGGGFANSTTTGQAATDLGFQGDTDGGVFFAGSGGGGTSCSEGVACGGMGGIDNNGMQGFGGNSGGSGDDVGPQGWINGDPSLSDNGDAGEGGRGDSTPCCDGGGGGGGFGGGGSGDSNSSAFDAACAGGGGGGSYATGSTSKDSDAPSTNPDHSGDGEVILTFNTDPS